MRLRASKKDKYMEKVLKGIEINKREMYEDLSDQYKQEQITHIAGRIINLELYVSQNIKRGEFEKAIDCFERRNFFYESIAGDISEIDVINRVKQFRKYYGRIRSGS